MNKLGVSQVGYASAVADALPNPKPVFSFDVTNALHCGQSAESLASQIEFRHAVLQRPQALDLGARANDRRERRMRSDGCHRSLGEFSSVVSRKRDQLPQDGRRRVAVLAGSRSVLRLNRERLVALCEYIHTMQEGRRENFSCGKRLSGQLRFRPAKCGISLVGPHERFGVRFAHKSLAADLIDV